MGSIEIVAYSSAQTANYLRRSIQRRKMHTQDLVPGKVGIFTSALLGRFTSAMNN